MNKCFIIGDPVEHSLSPEIHGSALKSLKLSKEFSYERMKVSKNELSFAMQRMRNENFLGFSVTMPLKEVILEYLDEIELGAQRIGAVNTVINDHGNIRGLNSDYEAIRNLLASKNVASKQVLILGSGGISRSAALAFSELGANICIMSRNKITASKVAEDFGGTFLKWQELTKLSKIDVVFNGTPIGMLPDPDCSPLQLNKLSQASLVFDSVYRPQNTLLLSNAKKLEIDIIRGDELFLMQALIQFEEFFKVDAPFDVMASTLRGLL